MEISLEQNTKSKPISGKNMKRYLKKEGAACQLITGNGSGFFCKFKLNNKIIKALFTNNHVLNADLIKDNSIIYITHKDKSKEIKLTSNRFKFTNEEYDYTCIEIFDNEGYDDFFEIDDNINCNNPDHQYRNKLCVLFQFPGDEDLSFGEGIIKGIINDYQIIHNITSDKGSSGSPIVLSDNLKVIGIHRGSFNDSNQGIFFNFILNDIQNQLNKNNQKILPIKTINFDGKDFDIYYYKQYRENGEKW